MAEELIFGADLGSAIFYNGKVYKYASTSLYSSPEFNDLGSKDVINIGARNFYYNDSGLYGPEETYDASRMASSYKYGWKYQGLTTESTSRVFPDNWIRPDPIELKPLNTKLEYQYYSTDSAVWNESRNSYEYSVIEYIAPVDGVLRMCGGVPSSSNNRFRLNESDSILSPYYTKTGTTSFTVHGDNITIKFYAYINDSIPIELPSETNRSPFLYTYGTTFSDITNSQYLFPIHLKAGDKVSFRPNYLELESPGSSGRPIPESLDLSNSNLFYWYNGIFFPNNY